MPDLPPLDPTLLEWLSSEPLEDEGGCAMEPLCHVAEHAREMRSTLLQFLHTVEVVAEESAGIFGMALAHGATYQGPTFEAVAKRALAVLIATATRPGEAKELQAQLELLERQYARIPKATKSDAPADIVSGPWSDTIEGAREGFERVNKVTLAALEAEAACE